MCKLVDPYYLQNKRQITRKVAFQITVSVEQIIIQKSFIFRETVEQEINKLTRLLLFRILIFLILNL